jgi:hypothetical protein
VLDFDCEAQYSLTVETQVRFLPAETIADGSCSLMAEYVELHCKAPIHQKSVSLQFDQSALHLPFCPRNLKRSQT